MVPFYVIFFYVSIFLITYSKSNYSNIFIDIIKNKYKNIKYYFINNNHNNNKNVIIQFNDDNNFGYYCRLNNNQVYCKEDNYYFHSHLFIV